MDRVHKPEEKPFVSSIVSLEEFYDSAKYAGFTPFHYDADNMEENVAFQIGCSVEVLNELSKVCNPENLRCGNEDDEDPLKNYIPPNTPLVTLRIQQNELEKRESVQTHRQQAAANLKFKRYNFRIMENYQEKATLDMAGRINYMPPDIILNLVIMKPYNRPLEHHEVRLGRLLVMDTVWLVRGNCKMTDLRDKIQCCSDYATNEDYSSDPENQARSLSKDEYPSGFFFINDTFYSDCRHSEVQDLSYPIRKWASKKCSELDGDKFSVRAMEESDFFHLKLRMGQPYVYLHQGYCEHLMVFTDLRLMHHEDCQELDQYPIQISSKMKKRIPCSVCKRFTAKWVTYGNTRLPFDPGFFCDECFKGFNYTEKGEKIGEFSAVPYFDRSALA